VRSTGEFEPAFARALAADGPTLIHIVLATEVITPRTTISAIRAAAR
jgi:acetolactate synthase-1/2/3 large subunit